MQRQTSGALPTAFGSFCSTGFDEEGPQTCDEEEQELLGWGHEALKRKGSPSLSPQFSLEMDSMPSDQPPTASGLHRIKKR